MAMGHVIIANEHGSCHRTLSPLEAKGVAYGHGSCHRTVSFLGAKGAVGSYRSWQTKRVIVMVLKFVLI